jgi:hypothetical protein
MAQVYQGQLAAARLVKETSVDVVMLMPRSVLVMSPVVPGP